MNDAQWGVWKRFEGSGKVFRIHENRLGSSPFCSLHRNIYKQLISDVSIGQKGGKVVLVMPSLVTTRRTLTTMI